MVLAIKASEEIDCSTLVWGEELSQFAVAEAGTSQLCSGPVWDSYR